jgi:hypothetical protein
MKSSKAKDSADHRGADPCPPLVEKKRGSHVILVCETAWNGSLKRGVWEPKQSRGLNRSPLEMIF